jgi:putative sterol carrier protein
MKYNNSDEIIRDMTRIYERMNEDEEVKEILNNIGSLKLHINYTDLDEWVTQSIENGKIALLKGKVGDASVSEQISSETFVEIFSGKVEPPEAAMAGKINFDGDFSKMLVLQPLLGKTRDAYIELILQQK